MSSRIEGHTGRWSERLVNTGEVVPSCEMFYGVVGWWSRRSRILQSQKYIRSARQVRSHGRRMYPLIRHQTQYGRNDRSSNLPSPSLPCPFAASSRPTSDQQCMRYGRTSLFLFILEQVHCTIHVLQLDPALHECSVSMLGLNPCLIV